MTRPTGGAYASVMSWDTFPADGALLKVYPRQRSPVRDDTFQVEVSTVFPDDTFEVGSTPS